MVSGKRVGGAPEDCGARQITGDKDGESEKQEENCQDGWVALEKHIICGHLQPASCIFLILFAHSSVFHIQWLRKAACLLRLCFFLLSHGLPVFTPCPKDQWWLRSLSTPPWIWANFYFPSSNKVTNFKCLSKTTASNPKQIDLGKACSFWCEGQWSTKSVALMGNIF